MIIRQTISVAATFLIVSCSSDTAFNLIETDENFSGVCFQSDILSLMVSSCTNVGCHNSVDREEGLVYTNYEGILESVDTKNPRESELFEYLMESDPEERMPPPPQNSLTDEQVNLLIQWIEKGAKYTTNCSSLDCDNIMNVSNSRDIVPILSRQCINCHSDVSKPGGYSYESYESTRSSVEDGSLLGSIQRLNGWQPMPLNANQIPECEISFLQTWINEGATNN